MNIKGCDKISLYLPHVSNYSQAPLSVLSTSNIRVLFKAHSISTIVNLVAVSCTVSCNYFQLISEWPRQPVMRLFSSHPVLSRILNHQ